MSSSSLTEPTLDSFATKSGGHVASDNNQFHNDFNIDCERDVRPPENIDDLIVSLSIFFKTPNWLLFDKSFVFLLIRWVSWFCQWPIT